jgi:hypothetical protein
MTRAGRVDPIGTGMRIVFAIAASKADSWKESVGTGPTLARRGP